MEIAFDELQQITERDLVEAITKLKNRKVQTWMEQSTRLKNLTENTQYINYQSSYARKGKNQIPLFI